MTEKLRVLAFDELDSTNAEAHRMAEKGEGGPLWITAKVQTAGRGRQGNSWVSGKGNLFATNVRTLNIKPAIAAQTSFVTALAIYETAALFLLPRHSGEGRNLSREVATRTTLTLKWPNDVLLNNKKLAGILIETVGTPDPGLITLAIGCGINIATAPSGTAYGATCLQDHTSAKLSPATVFKTLNAELDHWFTLWNNGENFEQITSAWQQRAAHIGKTVSITNGNTTTTGSFTGLADSGALLLTLKDGTTKTFHAGQVSLRAEEL